MLNLQTNGLDIFNISRKDFEDIKTTDLVAAKWFGELWVCQKNMLKVFLKLRC